MGLMELQLNNIHNVEKQFRKKEGEINWRLDVDFSSALADFFAFY
jgi:hypothetical protein